MVAPEEQLVTLRVTGPEGEIEADLWTGEFRRRARGEGWTEGAAPASEPICGFSGVRESITEFLACVRSGDVTRSNLEASRRAHAATLACAAAEITQQQTTSEER